MNLRLQNLFTSMSVNKIDGLLVSSPPNVRYLSGFKSMDSWILVSSKGLYFITDSRYAEQAKKEAKGFKIVLRDKKSVFEIVGDLAKKMNLQSVGFEAAIVTYSFYTALVRVVGKEKLKPAVDLVENLRVTKDASEIRLIRRSVDIAVKGYHYVCEIATPGMKEREIQGRLEYYTKSLGAEKPAFDIIIASGARSSMPHCQTDETVIRDNHVLLVDMGVVYDGYHSDLTRPIFLGKLTSFQRRIYRIVREAQQAGIRKAAPGVSCREVDQACRDFIRKKGYGDYFGHGTGHGVGLEIHEAPTVSGRSQTILKPGMVITVEPGVYLPGKIGIRIEDMVLITDRGNEVLTKGLDE